MKMLIAVALAATSFPVLTTAAAAGDRDSAASQRRYCTQVAVRAGSRMSARRICRTAAQWREALGPDWRLSLAGAPSLDDEMQELAVRSQGTADSFSSTASPR